MKKIIALFLLLSQAAGADTIRTDVSTFGKPGSSADKRLILDINQGASNPDIRSNVTDQDLQLRANTVRIGKPTVGNKTLDFNIGSGATNPKLRYNSSSTKLEFSNNGTDFKAVGSGSGGAGGITLLGDVNADFEAGSTGWTASSGSFTVATTGSNLLFETRSGVFNSSASGQTLSNSLVTIPVGLQSGNGAASCWFKTAASDYKIQVTDGTNVLGERVIPALSTAQKIGMTFVFPSTGSVRLRIISQSDAADIAIDNCFLGENALIDISQAELVGSLTYVGTAGCVWTTGNTSNAFTPFAAQASCPTPTVTGKASAPATKIPAISFGSLAPGKYVVITRGYLVSEVDATNALMPFGTHDGVSLLSGKTVVRVSSSAGSAWQNVLISEVEYTTAQSNKTFEIRAASDTNSNDPTIEDSVSTLDFVMSVYRYPTSSQSALAFGSVGQSWRGDVSGNTALTSVSNVDYPGTATVTETYNRNFGVVTPSAASNGITFTPAFDSDAEVCYVASIVNTTIADVTLVVVMNGTQIDTESRTTAARAAAYITVSKCVYAHLLTTSAQEFKLQGGSASGAQTISNVQWTVKMLDQQTPAPLLVNGVVSPSAGVVTVAKARIGGAGSDTSNCTSDPCTIWDSTGSWISSVNRGGTGIYTVNLAANAFSSTPACMVGGFNGANGITTIQSAHTSTSSWGGQFFIFGGAATDVAFDIMCMGSK